MIEVNGNSATLRTEDGREAFVTLREDGLIVLAVDENHELIGEEPGVYRLVPCGEETADTYTDTDGARWRHDGDGTHERIQSITGTAESREREAMDAARCDGQIWANLPESARNFYRESV